MQSTDNGKTYGSPRILHALLALGWKCSRNRVARLMRRNGIRAKQKRRFKRTTKRNKAHPVAPNLLKRDFAAEQPDQKWLADTLALHASTCVTYIPTLEGWLYLATVLDLYARRIVGCAMVWRMETRLSFDSCGCPELTAGGSWFSLWRPHHVIRLNSAKTPKPEMINPEILFIHLIPAGLERVRKTLAPLLSKSHHKADPMNTPRTNVAAEKLLPAALANPTPAKIAVKERIVIGLVRVRSSVER